MPTEMENRTVLEHRQQQRECHECGQQIERRHGADAPIRRVAIESRQASSLRGLESIKRVMAVRRDGIPGVEDSEPERDRQKRECDHYSPEDESQSDDARDQSAPASVLTRSLPLLVVNAVPAAAPPPIEEIPDSEREQKQQGVDPPPTISRAPDRSRSAAFARGCALASRGRGHDAGVVRRGVTVRAECDEVRQVVTSAARNVNDMVRVELGVTVGTALIATVLTGVIVAFVDAAPALIPVRWIAVAVA